MRTTRSQIFLYCFQCNKSVLHQRIQTNDSVIYDCCVCGYEYEMPYSLPVHIPILDELTLAVHKAIQEVKLESS